MEHLLLGLLVEGLVGLGGPLAGLVEGFGFGLVDEVLVLEAFLGERYLKAVAFDSDGAIGQVLHVDTQA